MVGDVQSCTVLSSHLKQSGRMRKAIDLLQQIYGMYWGPQTVI